MWGLLGCTWIDADTLAERLASDPPAEAPGALAVVLDPVDFGAVAVGASRTLVLPVENVGAGALTLTVAVSGSGYSAAADRLLLAPDGVDGIPITFAPLAEGAAEGALVLDTDDPASPVVTIALLGVATVDHDADGDGYEAAPDGDDCDDTDATVFPGAFETWYDGVDQDCDGADDHDRDGDGHARIPEGDDCDDTDASAHPGATDAAYTGVDEDCDGVVDPMSATLAAWTVRGLGPGDGLGGGGVHALDDLDGDGLPELAVASPDADVGSDADLGAVDLFAASGAGLNLRRDAGWRGHVGAAPGDRFGAALVWFGDIDMDGVVELAVGAPGADDGASGGGAVYVLEGGEGVDLPATNASIAQLSARSAAAALGAALAAGDLDGDGVRELASGAPGDAEGRGAVVVTFAADLAGGALDPADALVRLLGDAPGDAAGDAVALADLDADGYADLLLCAPGHDGAGDDAGACWLVRGAAEPALRPGVAASAAAEAVFVGAPGAAPRALAAGDLGGDGVPDLGVATATGVWLFAGAPGGAFDAASATWSVSGATALALADLDGDGADDLLVGVPGAEAGAVYLLAPAAPGALVLPGAQAASWSGESPGDALGTTFAAADLHADGRPDLAVSAPGQDATGTDAGTLYVVPGY